MNSPALDSLQARLAASFYVRLAILAPFTLGIGSLVIWWISRSYVASLDDQGVTSRAHQRFAWSELKAVRPRYVRRGTRSYLNDVGLVFTNGSVSVFPAVLQNGGEVLDWLRRRTNQPIPTAT